VVRRGLSALAATALAVALGCTSTSASHDLPASSPARVPARGAIRCGPGGHPPEDYDSHRPPCPTSEPASGTPCPKKDLACQYLDPARGPCEYDVCDCDADDGAPVWRCDHAME
jgi:hypothetical protein